MNNEIDKLRGGINRRIHLDTYSSISFFSFLFFSLFTLRLVDGIRRILDTLARERGEY